MSGCNRSSSPYIGFESQTRVHVPRGAIGAGPHTQACIDNDVAFMAAGAQSSLALAGGLPAWRSIIVAVNQSDSENQMHDAPRPGRLLRTRSCRVERPFTATCAARVAFATLRRLAYAVAHEK